MVYAFIEQCMLLSAPGVAWYFLFSGAAGFDLAQERL